MSTQAQKDEARTLRKQLAEAMPSSLRAPLMAVLEGIEQPGTAEDVLIFARAALAKA